MKQFVLTTTSESGDHYIYFIEHSKKPTATQLKKFLKVHATDKDDGNVYEYAQTCEEIKNFLTIPIKTIK